MSKMTAYLNNIAKSSAARLLDQAIDIAMMNHNDEPTICQILDSFQGIGRGRFHRRIDATTKEEFVVVEMNGEAFDVYRNADRMWVWSYHYVN